MKTRFLRKIRFAAFPIFRTKSDNWFRSLLLNLGFPTFHVSSHSPLLLWPSPVLYLQRNVGMQLLNAASAPPFSRWWKMRARRRLRRLNLCHLSASPWLLDLSASLHLRKQEQEEIGTANKRSLVLEVSQNNEGRKCHTDAFLLFCNCFFFLFGFFLSFLSWRILAAGQRIFFFSVINIVLVWRSFSSFQIFFTSRFIV